MNDIRKPYSHSRSKSNKVLDARLDARVEAFEKRDYRDTKEEGGGKEKEKERKVIKQTKIANGVIVSPARKTKKNGKSKVWLFLFSLLCIGFFYVYTYVLNSAVITVTPHYADIEIHKVEHFGFGEDLTPYTLATTSIQKTKQLQKGESKKIETKAEGVIRMYNNYDASPMRLIKNTRVEGNNGKVYRLTKSITIPPKKGTIPGSIEVTIIAESTGADYNVEASDFSLPGLKTSPRYTAVYGRSKTAIAGGNATTKSYVSKSELSAAVDEFTIASQQTLKNKMKDIEMEGYVAIVESITLEVEDNQKSILDGDEDVYKGTATAYIMLVKESDMAKILARSQSQYQGEGVRISNKDDIKKTLTYSFKNDVAIDKNVPVEMHVDGTARIIYTFDANRLREQALSKKSKDFSAVLSTFPSIAKAEMKISPVWTSTFPSTVNKITVKEKVEAIPNSK